MFATFICKNCHNKIIIDFSNYDEIPSSCSNCGSIFTNSHYIDSFADKFLSLQRALHDLKFVGLSSGKSNFVYESDMNTLNELYNHSSPEVKSLLTSILDMNFLMVYHAAKDEDLEALKKYYSHLKLIHSEKINLKNKQMEDLLKED